MSNKVMAPPNGRQRRLLYYLLIVAIIALSWIGLLDQLSTDYVDGALVDAGVAFGLARGFNALFSMAQSLTITLGVGAGIDLSVGELLDPVNDLVEDFSHIMKLSIGSLALQKVLLLIVSDWVFKLAVTLAGVAALVTIWLRRAAALALTLKAFWTLVFLRFVLVAIVLLNGAVDRVFLDRLVEQDVSQLDALPYNLEEVSGDLSPADRAAYEDQVAELDSEIAQLETRIREAEGLIVQLESDVASLQQQRGAVQQELGLVERFNYFSENEQLSAINERLALASERLRSEEDRLDDLQTERETLLADRQLIESTLSGNEQGFLGIMSSGVSGALDRIKRLGEILNPSQLLNSFESAVDTIIRLMAVFLFKTVALPLLFLYLLTRFFNRVWNTDFGWQLRPSQSRKAERPPQG